jgi:hypothetical protein
MIDKPRIGPPPLVPSDGRKNPFSQPSTWLIMAGLVGLAASEFSLPWASIPGQVIVDGRTEPDGAITLVLASLILILAVSRSVADSDSRLARAAPGLLGVSLVATAYDALHATTNVLGEYAALGASATLSPGMASEVVGSVAVAIGGAIVSVVMIRAASRRSGELVGADPASARWLPPDWVDPEMQRLVPDRPVLATVGAVGVVLGFVIAVWLAGALGGGDSSGARIAGLGLAGILLGPTVTVWLWRQQKVRRR